MKIALCNDTHFGARNDSLIFNEYFFEFWENVFFPYLEKEGIKTILHLGDVVDRRKFINFGILNQLRRRFMQRLVDLGITMYVMLGNHDVFHKNTNAVNSVTELFHGYDNVIIYTSPSKIDFGDGHEFDLIPWINSENLDETLEFIRTSRNTVAFGHLELAGFEMDPGLVCKDGMDRKIFDKYSIVMSGHYHHESTDGHIWYLGAQYQMTWADWNDTKGFHVFDTETHKLTRVVNPHVMFHKYNYSDFTEEQRGDILKQLESGYFKKYANKFVRVIVVNKKDLGLYDRVLEAIDKAAPADLSVVEDYTLDSSLENESLHAGEDTLTSLNNFIDMFQVAEGSSKTEWDTDTLKTKVRELYMEALALEASQQE